MDDIVYEYWGKASDTPDEYHLLPYHCLDVAAVGNAILQENRILLNLFTSKLGIEEDDFLRFSSFFQSLHDLGKFSIIFQSKKPDLKKKLTGSDEIMEGPPRHDTLGAIIWNKDTRKFAYENNILDKRGKGVYEPWLLAAFGHHGIPPELAKSSSYDPAYLYTDRDLHACRAFTAECGCLFTPSDTPGLLDDRKRSIKKSRHLSWIFAGLTVISDWIGSNRRYFPYCSDIIPLDEYWERYAIPCARRAIENLGIIAPPVSAETGIMSLFDAFNPATERHLTPSELQVYASEFSPGPGPHLFIIEEATGSGKTEAAITLAHNLMAAGQADGLYFALPTMATANSMYRRVGGMYRRLYDDGRPSLILAHSAREQIGFLNSSQPQREDDATFWLYDNRKKALLAHVGVGTIDQALIGILPHRHQSLRLFGLSTHVLIVDEVHAYDPYMNELLMQIIRYRAGIGESTILLSATLPEKDRKRFVDAFCEGAEIEKQVIQSRDYPLITHACGGDNVKVEEIPVSPHQKERRSVALRFVHTADDVISIIRSVTESGQCVCWIRNTVADAVEAYEQLGGVIDPAHLHLFHARFALGHRIERENAVIALFGKDSKEDERKGQVLIATQVVEQSLDIDFDVMITDLAPVDLIIQRAGRLHRHPREGRGDPVLYIFSPPPDDDPADDWYSSFFPHGAYVYPEHVKLWKTARILQQAGEIISPDAHSPGNLRDLIEGVFGETENDTIPASLMERDKVATQRIKEMQSRAMISSIPLHSGYKETGGRWGQDHETPTRLSIPSITLRLGVIDEITGDIHPLCGEGRQAWYLSSLSVALYHFGDGIVHSREITDKIRSAEQSMPDRGKFSILLPLRRDNDDTWTGEVSTENGERRRFTYKKDVGLVFEEH
ncbi:MAG: CRISPR-associated helicase Cas3' [Methanoculleaceae archaeon]